MIDDAFLRQTAALQANLKMLESQQDALSDLADMKELRLYKARLSDYIEAHSNAGNLPPDPFHVIQQRLVAVSDFFTAADQEYQRITSWKKNWLKGIPNISLSDTQSAKTELSDLVAEIPHVQQRLWQMISQLDWDTSSRTVDLYPELLACAQCVDRLILRSKDGSRHDLYQFAQGEGKLAKGVSSHLTAMGMRIDELISLHEKHQALLAEAEAHLANENFRSAEKSLKKLEVRRFSDLDYTSVQSRLQMAMGVLAKFTSLDASLKQLLEKGAYKAVKAELSQLHSLIEKPDSELGREASAILQKMESRLTVAQKAHKKRTVTRVALISLFIAGLGTFSPYVLKMEREATQARVKADIELTQAKAKKKAAWANSSGKRAGEEKVIEIARDVTMTFCWCPAGGFTMGSPKFEANRDDYEDQVEVTLSQGFWMAKTEVNQSQWEAIMGNNPSNFQGAYRPVESVTWEDAEEFLMKVNAIVGDSDGGRMVLPTEAQWEYAARAGEAGMYSGGALDEVAWYEANSGSRTHDVGTKNANAWGLHDMHGNVWEWCTDGSVGELEGGIDPVSPAYSLFRALRGGDWNAKGFNCRVARRSSHSSDPSYGTCNGHGFRVVRSSVP